MTDEVDRASPWLGVIADDVTGASDAASYIARAGLRTVQHFGIPGSLHNDGVDCHVVSLKTRNLPSDEAVSQSLAALDKLLESGVSHIYVKYCSTFDSTPRGTIGPVLDAVAERLGEDRVVVVPSAPENGRTVYLGTLFVNDVPLAESAMRDHPLTPMTDSNLLRLLEPQSRSAATLITYQKVGRGATEIERAVAASPRGNVVIDAIDDDDLDCIAAAVSARRMSSGSAGLAGALARSRGRGVSAAVRRPAPGRTVIIAGSCSAMTRKQVERYATTHPAFAVDPASIAAGEDVVGQAIAFLARNHDSSPILYSSADPEAVNRVQSLLGKEQAASIVEATFAAVSLAISKLDSVRIVVAGGETSGAVVSALQISTAELGAELATGVPWLFPQGNGMPAALLLKSGNFGGVDFFVDAERDGQLVSSKEEG